MRSNTVTTSMVTALVAAIQEILERAHKHHNLFPLTTSPSEFCGGHNLSYLSPVSSSVAFPRSFSKKIKTQVYLPFTRIKWCMLWKLTLPLSPLMLVAQKGYMVSQDSFNIFLHYKSCDLKILEKRNF